MITLAHTLAEIALPSEQDYKQHPMYLSVSGCFYESPSIHFVIEHPPMVHALQNFSIPVME